MSSPKSENWSKCSCHENASLFGRRRGKLPSVYPLRVYRRHVWTTPRGKGSSCLSCTIFPPRCCLGTPEEWVEDAIILNKPNAVIKQNLEAFNYQHISMLQMGKQHFVYQSRGIGKKSLFLPLIKRILWNS